MYLVLLYYYSRVCEKNKLVFIKKNYPFWDILSRPVFGACYKLTNVEFENNVYMNVLRAFVCFISFQRWARVEENANENEV